MDRMKKAQASRYLSKEKLANNLINDSYDCSGDESCGRSLVGGLTNDNHTVHQGISGPLTIVECQNLHLGIGRLHNVLWRIGWRVKKPLVQVNAMWICHGFLMLALVEFYPSYGTKWLINSKNCRHDVQLELEYWNSLIIFCILGANPPLGVMESLWIVFRWFCI